MSRTATYITVDLYFRDREKQNDRLNKLDERSLNHENLLSEVLSKQEDHSSRLKQVEEKLIQVDDRLTRVEDRLTRVEDRLTRVEDRLTGVEHRLTHLEVMFIRSEARTVNSTKSGLWEMVKWFPIHADKGDQWPEDAPDTAQEFWLLGHEPQRLTSLLQFYDLTGFRYWGNWLHGYGGLPKAALGLEEAVAAYPRLAIDELAKHIGLVRDQFLELKRQIHKRMREESVEASSKRLKTRTSPPALHPTIEAYSKRAKTRASNRFSPPALLPGIPHEFLFENPASSSPSSKQSSDHYILTYGSQTPPRGAQLPPSQRLQDVKRRGSGKTDSEGSETEKTERTERSERTEQSESAERRNVAGTECRYATEPIRDSSADNSDGERLESNSLEEDT
ncbi:MAG: hypothetical protein MMC23_001690 [Stictis urceolatum]|nr:hypothetical protein [Stictis urceolata]